MAALPPRPLESKRLSDLSVGTVAVLQEVHLDAEAHAVLRGLGLTDASVLRVCKRGEPCVVQVHATRIGISARVARHIFVQPQAAEATTAPV